MLVYIWIRFEWPFAVGAIATLMLDVTKVVGFFALTGIDFNLTAIAALLTLVGYSVNDKVVVYDRMRENMRLYKAMPLRDLIDKSINETLARSLYTSVTAFLAMLPMAIWGGSAVESFAVPMVFGIVVAASSSIFIAAPILLFLGDWRTRRRATAGNPAGAEDGVRRKCAATLEGSPPRERSLSLLCGGRIAGGGFAMGRQRILAHAATPLPNPPPAKGERRQTEFAARVAPADLGAAHPGMNRGLVGKFANVDSGTLKFVASSRCGLAAIQVLSEIDL